MRTDEYPIIMVHTPDTRSSPVFTKPGVFAPYQVNAQMSAASYRLKNIIAWSIAGALLVAYFLIALNRPWSLQTQHIHDDALYMRLAASLVSGEWLGAYDDRTLAKPPGFPFFLALTSTSGLPFNIAVGLFNASASALFSYGIFRLTSSRIAGLLTFTLVLFSPQHFEITRVIRETIYPYQVLAYLGFLLVWWSTATAGWKWLVLAGLTFGWIWITREDGIWLVPGTLLFFLLTPAPVRRRLHAALIFTVAAISIPLLLGAANAAHYGRWSISEMKDPVFVSAISATQSVVVGNRIQGVAVTARAREEIYKASPAFSELREILESPEYFTFACAYNRSSCGEIANGFWHWAVRYAAWQRGKHSSPQEAAAFYRQIKAEIETACERGDFACDVRFADSLPTIIDADLVNVPGYTLDLLLTSLLFKGVQVQPDPSTGGEAELGAASKLLNNPPALGPTHPSLVFMTSIRDYSESGAAAGISVVAMMYRAAFYSLLAFALIGIIATMVKWRFARFGALERVALVITVLIGARLALLALVGVTSFPTNNAIYLGPVYQMIASVLVLGVASALFCWRRSLRSPIPLNS